MATTNVNGPSTPFASERISTLTSSTGLTAATYNVGAVQENGQSGAVYVSDRGADEALITVEIGDIRYTLDGTEPTTTASTKIGHLAAASDILVLVGRDAIRRFRAINAVGASGAALYVTYFRRG
jgi:hypothetical protein